MRGGAVLLSLDCCSAAASSSVLLFCPEETPSLKKPCLFVLRPELFWIEMFFTTKKGGPQMGSFLF